MEHGYLIDKKGKKWVINGYYIDGKGNSWTLLYLMDDWRKTKKVKGII
jgi:hypothetical protein